MLQSSQDGRKLLTMGFLFQPHIHGRDAVITPDLHLTHLVIVDGESGRHDIGVESLTTGTEIQVVGQSTAASAGIIFIAAGYGTLVGVADDHFDMLLLSHATVARQACPKPIGRQVWRFADIENHLDQLILRCWHGDNKQPRGSEEAELGGLRSIVERAAVETHGLGQLPNGTAILVSGITQPIQGSPVNLEIEDTARRRTLSHRFSVSQLRDGSVPD